MNLDDLRLFAKVVEAGSFTAAAKLLDMPKQTLSRRVAELERALDVHLLFRTTRRLRPTEAGAAYAERCAEITRLAEEASRALTDSRREPKGVLRVTADPLFGEAFVTPLIVEYAGRFPEVHVEVILTRRRVDLIEEGFDVAFRVGRADGRNLTATSLGPARVRYCASPRYVRERGRPRVPSDLAKHECIVVHSDGAPRGWPFPGRKGITLVPVSGRLRFSDFAMARAAALAGLGIGLFPEFACEDDLRRKRLVTVLGDAVDVGAVWLVHPTHRYLSARVQSFVELAIERLRNAPPWVNKNEL